VKGLGKGFIDTSTHWTLNIDHMIFVLVDASMVDGQCVDGSMVNVSMVNENTYQHAGYFFLFPR